MERCPWAIRWGERLVTRCFREAGHTTILPGFAVMHVGRGLPRFSYQRFEWFEGDAREFKTDRDEAYSWEEPAGRR